MALSEPVQFLCVQLHALDLFDLRGLALKITQIVQLGTANLAFAQYFNVVHTRGMQRESTLHTNAIRNAAHSERFTNTAIALGDHGTGERLKTLMGTFHDLDPHVDSIANVELRTIVPKLLCFNRTDNFAHLSDPPSFIDVRIRLLHNVHVPNSGPPVVTNAILSQRGMLCKGFQRKNSFLPGTRLLFMTRQ